MVKVTDQGQMEFGGETRKKDVSGAELPNLLLDFHIHHNKKMCHVHNQGLYVQGHRPKSKVKSFSSGLTFTSLNQLSYHLEQVSTITRQYVIEGYTALGLSVLTTIINTLE